MAEKLSAKLKSGFTGAVKGVTSRLSQVGSGTAKRDQLLAAVLLPFFLVVAMVASGVVKEVIEDALPDDLGTLGPLNFLIGIVLVIGTFAASFAWVKTGGFGVFAR